MRKGMGKKWLICGLLLTVLVLFAAGCQEHRDEGLKREYAQSKEVSLTMFGTKALNSSVWGDYIRSADGTNMRIIEESASYYTSDGSQEAYRTYLFNQLQNGTGIDLFVVFDEDVRDLDQMGMLTDLNVIKGTENFSEDALEGCSFEGKIFAIPLIYTGYGFYWNMDILEQYGLKVPGNLDEFLNVCETLKKNGEVPYVGNKGYALTVPAMVAGFSELYRSADRDEQIRKLAEGTVPVSDYMRKGFELLELMRDQGYIDVEYAMQTAPNDAMKDFAAGKGACFCGAIGADMSGAEFRYQMSGVTVLPEGAGAVTGTARQITVNPNSPHFEYALEALEYIAEPPQLMRIAKELKAMCAVDDPSIDYEYMGEEMSGFVSLLQSESHVPIQDFALPFGTWANIRDIGREIMNGRSAAWASEEYDRQQMEAVKSNSLEK